MEYSIAGGTNLLLLVLSVLGDEVSQGLVDAALLKELVELILERDIERVELKRDAQSPDKQRAHSKSLPEGQGSIPDASSRPQQ